MQIPLFLGTQNVTGKVGGKVKLFAGNWIIDWKCDSTLALSVDGSEFTEIANGYRFQLSEPKDVQLKILSGSSPIFAWAGSY